MAPYILMKLKSVVWQEKEERKRVEDFYVSYVGIHKPYTPVYL